MDKVRHIWRHGFWGGQCHTTVQFESEGSMIYACSCGETKGDIPNLREA